MGRITILCAFLLTGAIAFAESLSIGGTLNGNSSGTLYGRTIMRKLRVELEYLPDVSFHQSIGSDETRISDRILWVDMTIVDVNTGVVIVTGLMWSNPHRDIAAQYDSHVMWLTAGYGESTRIAEHVATFIDNYLQSYLPGTLR